MNSIDDFSKLIIQQMQDYNAELTEKVNKIADEVGIEALKKIKKLSPKRSKEYSKGWRYEKLFNNDGTVRIRIYNKKYYNLTHLLEYGHSLKGGGRAKAFPHISTVQEWANAEIMRRIENEI